MRVMIPFICIGKVNNFYELQNIIRTEMYCSIPQLRPAWETFRLDEAWTFPWLWTKTKTERCNHSFNII